MAVINPFGHKISALTWIGRTKVVLRPVHALKPRPGAWDRSPHRWLANRAAALCGVWMGRTTNRRTAEQALLDRMTAARCGPQVFVLQGSGSRGVGSAFARASGIDLDHPYMGSPTEISAGIIK